MHRLKLLGAVRRGVMIVVACGAMAGLAPAAGVDDFQTIAPFAYLIDAATGTVLFEKNGDGQMAPASTAKIMTAEVVFHDVRDGRLKLDDKFTVSEHAWRDGGARSGGSAMFLPVNSSVRVEDLLRGLIIQSGNDAAITLAEGIAGSEEAFAKRMNDRAKAIGLTHSTFTNPWGRGDPGQRVTPSDMARLAKYVIETYPDFYRIFGEREFTWNKIRQLNRNPLLTMNIGADGLKTGDIAESGFGLVGSAVQNDQRLIVVVNGLRTARDRANESQKLLAWGFRTFEERQLFDAGEVVGTASVFGGAQSDVKLVTLKPTRLLVPRGSGERLAARITYIGPLMAPVEKGITVAQLKIARGATDLMEVPLATAEAVPTGSLQKRAWDAGFELVGGFIAGVWRSDEHPSSVLITLEGGEGVGKSTQVQRLIERLQQAGWPAVATREPGGSPKAEAIRGLLLSGAAKPLGAEAEALLFSAARIDHVDRMIRPAIAAGRSVVSDRFIDSTRAYQGAAGHVAPTLLSAVEQLAIGVTRPDLTIMLDLPVEVGLSRAAARRSTPGPDRFESEALSFHGVLRCAFLAIAQDEPGRCAVVDASQGVNVVAEAIWVAVQARLLGPATDRNAT